MSLLKTLGAQWLKLTSPKFSGDWWSVHFVAGHRVPRGARGKFGAGPALRLPPDVMAGFSVVGCFGPEGYEPEPVGKATMVFGGREAERSFPEFPYFKVYLYPEDDGKTPLKVLWSRVEERLPHLFWKALLAMLQTSEGSDFAGPSAIGRLVWLKEKGSLDAHDRACIEHLETASIFRDYGFPGDDSKRLALQQLREADTLFLIRSLDGYKLDGRKRRPGLYFLENSRDMARICALYDLPLAKKHELATELARALQKFISKQERESAVEMSFGAARRFGMVVEFVWCGGVLLTVDLRNRILRGVDASGAAVEVSFDSIRRLDIEESTLLGDTKTHRFFHLAISDGRRTLLYYERYPEYYERGSVQAELDREHFKSQTILHALAPAMGFKGARLEREDLVPKKGLLELL